MMYCKRDGHPITYDETCNGDRLFFDGLAEVGADTPVIYRCPGCNKPLSLANLLTAEEHLYALAYAVRVQTAWAGIAMRRAA